MGLGIADTFVISFVLELALVTAEINTLVRSCWPICCLFMFYVREINDKLCYYLLAIISYEYSWFKRNEIREKYC